MQKLLYLENYLRRYLSQGICLAYSGGTDSATLLAVLLKLRRDNEFPLSAVYIHSVLQSANTLEFIQDGVKDFPIDVIEADPLRIADVLNNTKKRCYACKLKLFSTIKEFAKSKNLKFIFDGSNTDDSKVFRPGRQALQELGIISPLLDCGFTKSDIKELANELDVKIIPSDSCLATRFPYNHKLELAEIEKVKEAETLLKNLGYNNVRVRLHEDLARIEIAVDQIPHFIENREEIFSLLKEYKFRYITLDLQGFRSGSMD